MAPMKGDPKAPCQLSAAERAGLRLLDEHGGSLIGWKVPESDEKDPVFGTTTPGIRIYRELEREGLMFFTAEEPLSLPGETLDGFQFSCEIYLSERGKAVAATALKNGAAAHCSSASCNSTIKIIYTTSPQVVAR